MHRVNISTVLVFSFLGKDTLAEDTLAEDTLAEYTGRFQNSTMK
jgi:hypothetical protein